MKSYTFKQGYPQEKCRPYNDKEWEKLVSSVLPPQTTRGDSPASPTAIFISGLPGGGKSSLLRSIYSELRKGELSVPALEQFAVIDFDEFRNFHEQYRFYSNQPCSDPPEAQFCSYLDLVPWFIEGTDFEETFFRNTTNRGLLPMIIAREISFVMEAVLDSAACFSYVQHVASSGYRVVLVHVHTPVEKSIARAEQRAYRTGRWSSPDFIRSRQEGLLKWFAPISNFVLRDTSSGAVAFFDNTIDNSAPTRIFYATDVQQIANVQVQYPQLWDQYEFAKLVGNSWQPQHLSKQRLKQIIVDYATQLVHNCLLPSPATLTPGWFVDFCIAGGCFKSIFTNNDPNDLDLWPTTTTDHEKLISLLQSNNNAQRFAKSLYNSQFSVSNGTTSLVLELVTKCDPPSLQGKVEKFDIAISAIGVAFHVDVNNENEWSCSVTDVYIHKDWTRSFELKQPLLILPMPNNKFLLATAERVLRYTKEFDWELPTIQLDYLKSQFNISPCKDLQISNYKNTTRGGEMQRLVCEHFNIR